MALSAAAPGRRPGRRQSPRGEERRAAILRALHDCVIEQGYARTTLADIARKAGLSPSHLLYYYAGKDAILDEYFKRVADRLLHRIDEFRAEPLARQIDLLSELFFAGKGLTRSEIGFMLECFGAAVNDPVLQVTKADFDVRCKAYLAEIFRMAPSVLLGDPRDAAEISYSVMIGLRSAVYFDDDIDLKDAHRLFVRSMLVMCALE